ncbi:MAG: prolyl oligopeptidase family serine peptidase [Ignavibacteriales bacterium]|nr:prolyl oligopeptidase family serine peptidase [Ignavibacteriales bacterium]
MKKVLVIVIFCFFALSLKAQQQIVLISPFIPSPDTIWVFLPQRYNPLQNYPAIYLLHGKGGSYKSWNEIIDLDSLATEYNFIIICPDGIDDLYYMNSPVNINYQYESYFFNILYPIILKRFSIDNEKIFITGFSMGGFGSFYLFLKKPDYFLSCGSSSGLLDLNYSASKNDRISELLGDYKNNKSRFNKYSPINSLSNIVGKNKHIFFDCGTEDYLYESNNKFREKCRKLKIKATFISQPGDHNLIYWRESVKFQFDFFNKLIAPNKDNK